MCTLAFGFVTQFFCINPTKNIFTLNFCMKRWLGVLDDKRRLHGGLLQVINKLLYTSSFFKYLHFSSEKFFSKRDLVVEEMEETTAKLEMVNGGVMDNYNRSCWPFRTSRRISERGNSPNIRKWCGTWSRNLTPAEQHRYREYFFNFFLPCCTFSLSRSSPCCQQSLWRCQ